MSHIYYGFMFKLAPSKSISPEEYFLNPVNVCHKQYEAMRAFFHEKKSAETVAGEHGYTQSALYSLARDFRKILKQGKSEDIFFRVNKVGRKEKDQIGDLEALIIKLRKQYLSVPEIKSVLDAKKFSVSESYVYSIIKRDGFARLPRREMKSRMENQSNLTEVIVAPKSMSLTFESDEIFNSRSAGVLCLIPFIRKYGLDTIIERSGYPETNTINKLSSILSFLCLKLNNIRRYSADDIWCMDRGNGLFANLNVLPKAAWFSSYSHRVTRSMNLNFLKQLHNVWKKNGFLSDTMNLDFTSIPYWGDDDHLENNWSGKRHISLGSMLAVLAQDPLFY